jgi:hypothetical protein
MHYGSKRDGSLVLRGLLRSKKMLALFAVVVVAAAVASVGLADIWTQTVQTDSAARLRVVYTYANNFDSGWHYHPGVAIVQVKKGSLTITNSVDCKAKTVSAGDTSIEIPYTAVRATSVGEAAWTTTFVLANGDPPATAVSTNPCP